MSFKYVIISLMLLIELLKLFTSANFFFNCCSNSYFQMVRLGIVDLFSAPFRWDKFKQIYGGKALYQYDRIYSLQVMMTKLLRDVEIQKRFQRLLHFPELVLGFLKSFFAIFFYTSSRFLPKFLKKSLRPSACIVLSLTVIDLFLLQIEQ